jgi:hypothetical protein
MIHYLLIVMLKLVRVHLVLIENALIPILILSYLNLDRIGLFI